MKPLFVIRSWLRNRTGFVIVNGKQSDPMGLFNRVFQGKEWGSSLWNAFFGDCVCAISRCGFEVIIYADDCNAFHLFPGHVSNDSVQDSLLECQASLHAWGRANRVTFDAGKEDTMIISTVSADGGPVKLLGIEFDNKLIMDMAAHKCATSAAFKTRSLLRAHRYYSTANFVMLCLRVWV